MGVKRPSNWLKNKIINVKENFNGTIKHFLKQNIYQLLTRNILYDLLLDVSSIESSDPGSNVNWDLKMTSTIEGCPL